MKYIPLNDFYIIKKKKQQNQHQSIIVMPSDTKIDLAEVISVPKDELESFGLDSTSPVNVGDCIAVRWSKVIGINEEVFGVALEDIVCKVEV